MKILCVIDSLGSGGAQRQLVGLAIGFKERGNEVAFLVYHNSYTFYNHFLDKAGIIINCIEEPNYIKRLYKIRHFIRNGGFDAVLSFLEAPSFYCEFAGLPYRKWRLVAGERSADPLISKSLKLKIYRWFHLFADYVVCNSNANKELVLSVTKILKSLKIRVIYNIIDFDYWKPLDSFSFRSDTKIRIVISASQSARKNFNGLVEALGLLRKDELEQIKIDWYGDSIHETNHDNSLLEARQKIKFLKLEKVISLYPATNEIIQKIQNADAIGLFSFVEGFPNAVLEGMACAKPVICSSISDIPEILSDEKNLLFDPYDIQSIKKAISYLITLSRDQLHNIGKRNEEICKEYFSRESIISDYLELLSK